jgi:NAD(P)H-nitrite reductase large subunit
VSAYKYLIIGGGIAGTTAAENIRARDTEGSIAIISDEPYPFYSRVLLSKPPFLTGAQPYESVWMKKPEWYVENRIIFHGGRSAEKLDPEKKIVTLDGGEEFFYEKLLLATGVHNRPWLVPGSEKKGIHYLRTLDHAKAIINDLRGSEGKRAVMIGSACVSFEVAEILLGKGIHVTEVMRERWYWEPSLSQRESSIVEKHLTEHGVEIIREMEVAEVLGGERVTGVRLKDGREIPCDMVFAFIGVVVPIQWLESSGIALDKAILCDEHMQTTLPDVWAAGDTARYKDVILDRQVLMGNWMNARAQGEIAGKNMTGAHEHFEMVSFHSSHGFGNMINFIGYISLRNVGEREVYRGNEASGKLGRFILQGGRIVGATNVNRTAEIATVVKLIKERVDVSGRIGELEDPNAELSNLLPK